MVSYGTVSLEDFKRLLQGEGTSTQKIQSDIAQANAPVEDQLPELFTFKPAVRSKLLNPGEARKELKGLISQRESTDRFLSVVSAVRDREVEITSVRKGHRGDGRDYILELLDPATGEKPLDLRVLLGEPGRKGGDKIGKEVMATAFYKQLGLSAYREKASFN